MADRKDPKPDRPFGAHAVEQAHNDLRTGERARPVPADRAGDATPTPEREAAADEVITGDRRAATTATPDRGQAHTADHSVAPPTGSNHAAVETPKSGRSTKSLIGVVVAVIVIIAIFLLLPVEAEAMLTSVMS